MQEFLPKVYCYVNEFNLSDLSKLRKNINIIYRNYDNIDYLNNLLKLKSFCKKVNNKLYLSNNIKLSIKLNLDGAYLPAFNKNYRHLSYNFKNDFLLVGSAHNLHEIRTKEKQGVSEIFVSSIFKKNNNFLGINKFKLISNLSKKKIIALGGVSYKNLNLIQLTKSVGFAGISYFK